MALPAFHLVLAWRVVAHEHVLIRLGFRAEVGLIMITHLVYSSAIAVRSSNLGASCHLRTLSLAYGANTPLISSAPYSS